jgi:hypothetical protein
MTCRPSPPSINDRSSQRAWSVLEMMIALSIASIVFAAVASISLFTARSFVAMGNYADLDRASRNALDVMSRDIRQAQHLTSYTSTRLDFTNADGTTFYYSYNSNLAKLTRVYDGVSTVMLTNCDYLTFNISQRNPSNNFTFYPASANRPDLVKLIDLSWKCSRQILGAKVNTESVQTAKIVMRN